jgi:cation transport ATPase
VGRPKIAQVVVTDGDDPLTVLARGAAVEQGSGHLLARVIVAEAESRGVALRVATDLHETPGRGVRGVVDGELVAVGSPDFVREQLPRMLPHAADSLTSRLAAMEEQASGLRAYIATGGGALARIEFADQLRPELAPMFGELRALGIVDAYLFSGDKQANVQVIAAAVGITQFAGDLSAAAKVARVAALEQMGRRVLMVGDGTNDAPSLSTATVGVALAGHGGGVVAEAADVVLLIDDPSRIPEAVRIGRRALSIAKQSIGVGLGLSLVGMAFASAGQLTPVAGALIQEAIDIAVILNALRAARA